MRISSFRNSVFAGLTALALGISSCPKQEPEGRKNLVHFDGMMPISITCNDAACIAILNDLENNVPTQATYTPFKDKLNRPRYITQAGSLLGYAKEKSLEVDIYGTFEGYDDNIRMFNLEGFKIRYPKDNPNYNKDPIVSFGETN